MRMTRNRQRTSCLARMARMLAEAFPIWNGGRFGENGTMETDFTTGDDYRARHDRCDVECDRFERWSRAVARARAISFLVGLTVIVWAQVDDAVPGDILTAFGVVLLVLFGGLVVWHARIDERRHWAAAKRTVNERALARLARDWRAPSGRASPRCRSIRGRGSGSLWPRLSHAAARTGYVVGTRDARALVARRGSTRGRTQSSGGGQGTRAAARIPTSPGDARAPRPGVRRVESRTPRGLGRE